MVSVGPYQLSSRTSGSRSRSVRTNLIGNGSPANRIARRSGIGSASMSPRSIIRISAPGTEYQTEMRSLRRKSTRPRGEYAAVAGTRLTGAPARNAA